MVCTTSWPTSSSVNTAARSDNSVSSAPSPKAGGPIRKTAWMIRAARAMAGWDAEITMVPAIEQARISTSSI